MSEATASTSGLSASDDEGTRGWPLVWVLSIGQLVSWGSIYYGFSLFVVPMEAEFGWSRAAMNGALSVGLLASGLCAYGVGAWIDVHGGRALMTAGSVVAAVLLALWSRIDSLWQLYAIWLGLGVAMSAVLYEPVFAVLTRTFPNSYRKRITVLTLTGGLASTVFIPLALLFIDRLGWRDALLVLALCNLIACVPIHAFLLRDGRPATHPAAAPGDGAAGKSALHRALRHPTFWALAICFTAYNATFSAMTFHIIPMLTEWQVPNALIVGTIAMIGPSQVAGRIVLLFFGRFLPPVLVGAVVSFLLPVSTLLLICFAGAPAALFVFAVLYGTGNGLMTIVRGTAVPDLMWREGYGAINGALTLPSNVARAVAPFGAAMIWDLSGGYEAVLWGVLGGAFLAASAFGVAVACSRTGRS